MQIEGKRVLVTGASRGLGRALVTAFVDAGAAEVIAGMRKPAIREETNDPPIGDEAKGVLDQLSKDAIGLEKMLASVK